MKRSSYLRTVHIGTFRIVTNNPPPSRRDKCGEEPVDPALSLPDGRRVTPPADPADPADPAGALTWAFTAIRNGAPWLNALRAALAAYHRFYSNGNKRTARYVMNAVLLSHGFDAIVTPAAQRESYNEALRDMYLSHDVTGFALFLTGLYDDV